MWSSFKALSVFVACLRGAVAVLVSTGRLPEDKLWPVCVVQLLCWCVQAGCVRINRGLSLGLFRSKASVTDKKYGNMERRDFLAARVLLLYVNWKTYCLFNIFGPALL
jgi:hypothetical protein